MEGLMFLDCHSLTVSKPKGLPVLQYHNPFQPLLFFVHNVHISIKIIRYVKKQENVILINNQEKNQLIKIDSSNAGITK